PTMKEMLPSSILSENDLISYDAAIRLIHFPRSRMDIDEARRRLAFNELFLIQYGLILLKKKTQDEELGIKHKRNGKLMKAALGNLPFELTGDQQAVLKSVITDMQKVSPMRRLIQGDVGSGKTVIAMLALIKTVENGCQGSFMAPTEILAVQHYEKFTKLLEPLGIRVGLLSAQVTRSKKRRAEVYEKIANQELDIIIGTHALIEEGVQFKKLGLVVTDEQHRFGVAQRAKLESKSELTPDILVMTATPIPRTMTLTVYGDLDVSQIKELPPGRKPIKTTVRHKQGRKQVYTFVRKELEAGRQAYVVCPLIEHSDSEKMQEISSAEEIFDELSCGMFKDFSCALLHGKMKPKEKDEIMQSFRTNEVNLLVSTTVIEVGVDVPNASVMVIEHAERFGLATLHQLRGRVGRGSDNSYCFLISDTKADVSKARLKIMETTSDGFKLAEEDLKLRGPGQFFGESQHGLPDLKIADVFRDVNLLLKARDSAEVFVQDEDNADSMELLNRHLSIAYGDKFKQIFNN
ncbi:MAG: ATP-dependent DNA helicase RecG, partial [Selenomonadaceae bacterium]|nr:ATP-dependent DNA helicase RecG [Selenomonadaceae bacterium]